MHRKEVVHEVDMSKVSEEVNLDQVNKAIKSIKFRRDYVCNEDRHYDTQVQAIMVNMIQI